MPNQIIEFAYAHGIALTLRVETPGEDEVVVSVAAEELEERTGVYHATLENSALSGEYQVTVLQASTPVANGFVTLTPAGGIFYPRNEPSARTGSFSASALAQLTRLGPITVSVPTLVGQQLSAPLVRGDSYLVEHDRAIEIPRADFPDLSGDETVTLKMRHVDSGEEFQIEGSIAVATGTKVLRFAPTSAQTVAWTVGKYEFWVEVEFEDDNIATFVGPNVYLRVIAGGAA